MSVVPQQLLAPGYAIPRLIKGGWQLAGGHGPVDRRSAIADMMAFAEAGITAFDCADIYTGVEELIGEFLRAWRERHGPNAPPVRVHTKCVPDRDLLPVLTFAHIEALIDRSLRRLGVDTLDLVQFHWWDYAAPRWLEAAGHLATLQRAGKIRHIGLTNFDTAHVQAIVESGVPVVSHQVQASLLDRRALRDMAAYCRAHQIGLLAYGALAGGFFHERWHGVPAPAEPLENRSLVKYRLIIEEFGGWHAFQQLLDCLTEVAVAHDTTVGAVAMRMMLDEPDITAVIVGARHAAHLASTCAALALTLNDDQRRAILALVHAAPGPGGDVYTLERDPTGPHAGIMRYNLNTASAP
ncbi:MAG: aldo/keto reductase [Gemmatimonas sp.]|uniref:aldo/keto reductase n=1 Tax=Gemmatimonas sp. TaxID=1962908 RepID=UPI0022CCB429|nr:aldo/keto reductase [Gemmatimonas sp.]MCE2954294.1 aldo/keto reductase [Gemmatimonas sp.]MCZ8013698.1 aldo/keto reductase [Gemmatimonas sp.]MCZ8267563.1 aldo/keto reductase [Gemmatimonas sp.]